MKVLIIEDEKCIADTYRLILAKAGIDHDIAYTGKEGIEKIKQHNHYDGVILDLMLPDINGELLIPEIRRYYTEDVPILIVSALGPENEIVQRVLYRVEGYLSKPFDPQEFLSLIGQISVLKEEGALPEKSRVTV